MKFKVHELRRATGDKRQIFRWIYDRSQSGAIAWLAAYDAMVYQLKRDAERFPQAYENPHLEMNVRESLFKTRRGRVYRALFIIESNDVYILRIRGPGQAPVKPADIELP